MKVLKYLLLVVLISGSCSITDKEFPDHVNVVKKKNAERINGTRIYCVLPDGYIKSEEKVLQYNRDEQTGIQFMEFQNSFAELKSNFNRQLINNPDIELNEFKEITVNQYDGLYIEGIDNDPDFTNLMLVFGNDSVLVIVSCMALLEDLKSKNELKTFLQTVYVDTEISYDPLIDATFSFDKSITGYSFTMRTNDYYIFGENGRNSLNRPTTNIFQIGTQPAKSLQEAEKYFEEIRDSFIQSGVHIEEGEVVKTVMGNYDMLSLTTPINVMNNEGMMYQAIVLGEKECLIFVGNAYSNADEVVDQYKKTVGSIRFK